MKHHITMNLAEARELYCKEKGVTEEDLKKFSQDHFSDMYADPVTVEISENAKEEKSYDESFFSEAIEMIRFIRENNRKGSHMDAVRATAKKYFLSEDAANNLVTEVVHLA